MKIGIYNEPAGGGIGGSEQCVGVLAAALAEKHEVDIVHHRPHLSREQLAEHCGVDLTCVGLRCVRWEARGANGSVSRNPWRHYREVSRWHETLSAPYDVFINFTHALPPFCHAPRGVLVVLFPAGARPDMMTESKTQALLTRLGRLQRDREWAARMKTYQTRLSISQFTQTWAERWWGVSSQVLYPPVDTVYEVVPKEDLVLSVGRFTVGGHMKRQFETVTAFGQMPDLERPGWHYACVGSVSEMAAEQEYFQEVCRAAEGHPIQVEANIERSRLRALYARASIFWHAAGYGEDSEAHPELMEHFGISTVEAMGAGCVPVAINRGGQPEIVTHGVDGFVWETLGQLKEYTQLLAQDGALRARMAEAARARAQDFSRERYVQNFLAALGLAS